MLAAGKQFSSMTTNIKSLTYYDCIQQDGTKVLEEDDIM